MEETSGTKCSAPRIQRQVNNSTTSEAAATMTSAQAAATGQGMPALVSAQTDMPPSMNRPGMLKFRKFSTPMLSVSATATMA